MNIEKSNFQAVQSIEWLGLLCDSKLIEEVQSILNFLVISFTLFTARELAEFAGQIISLSPVCGCVCSLMTRHIYLAVESRGHWDHIMNLEFPDLVKTELEFWTNNLVKISYKLLIVESLHFVLVFSDASSVGAGSYAIVNKKIVHHIWSKSESFMSSTWREIKAFY